MIDIVANTIDFVLGFLQIGINYLFAGVEGLSSTVFGK